MYRNILLAIIFLITWSSTESLFIQDSKDAGRIKNNNEVYVDVIKPKMRTLKKRDVYSIDTVSVPVGVQPKEDTIIIVPNSGVNNYPYNNYYDPRNPVPRYGPNTGSTVIVNNPDGNYGSGYGGKYFPNKYTNKYG